MSAMSMVHIDGSHGEGGGQILRSALALSAATGRPFRMTRVRAGRKKPGLQPQHLAAVKAVARICGARVEGAARGGMELTFEPGPVMPAGHEHTFAVGTAGSATLVAHAVLPALVHARVPARLVIEGGTHVPFAPVAEHLRLAYAGALARMGIRVDVELEAHGFMPEGGGRLVVTLAAAGRPAPLALVERGAVRALKLVAIAGARVPAHVVPREIEALTHRLGRRALEHVDVIAAPRGGNALALLVESEGAVEVFSAIGERHTRAEQVAERLAHEVNAHLEAGVPVGEHLADQLLLPMALGQGGAFVTVAPTEHTRTNVDVIRRFLDVEVTILPAGRATRIEVSV